jgi:hypothetical protein
MFIARFFASLEEDFLKALDKISNENIFSNQSRTVLKAVRLDHIWPVRFQLTYIIKQQVFNSGFWWQFDMDNLVRIDGFCIYHLIFTRPLYYSQSKIKLENLTVHP